MNILRFLIDPCASISCHYGYCVTNLTGIAYCKCDEKWEGENCILKSAIWFPWDEWKDCAKPKCEKQIRRRDCSKKHRNCSQINLENEQILDCNLIECYSEELIRCYHMLRTKLWLRNLVSTVMKRLL
jgi:hypothetical protein